MHQKSGKNNKLFLLGMICLVSSLGFILFALYIIPYLLWDLAYNIPESIVIMISFFQDNYNYSSFQAKCVVWLIFTVPGVITGFLSYYISNEIDKEIFQSSEERDETSKSSKNNKNK